MTQTSTSNIDLAAALAEAEEQLPGGKPEKPGPAPRGLRGDARR